MALFILFKERPTTLYFQRVQWEKRQSDEYWKEVQNIAIPVGLFAIVITLLCGCYCCLKKKRTNKSNTKDVEDDNNTAPDKAINNPFLSKINKVNTQTQNELPYSLEPVSVTSNVSITQSSAPSAPSENMPMGMPEIPPPAYPTGPGYSLTPPNVNL